MGGMKDMADRVRAYLGEHGLSGAGTVRVDGDRVRWGRLSLVDYGEFFAVEDPMADRDFVGSSVEEALEEYYG